MSYRAGCDDESSREMNCNRKKKKKKKKRKKEKRKKERKKDDGQRDSRDRGPWSKNKENRCFVCVDTAPFHVRRHESVVPFAEFPSRKSPYPPNLNPCSRRQEWNIYLHTRPDLAAVSQLPAKVNNDLKFTSRSIDNSANCPRFLYLRACPAEIKTFARQTIAKHTIEN